MEFLKAELLASVSHELRSPLTSIKGYAATLLRHEQHISREERHSFLLAIEESSDHLADVIDTLLEIAELDMGRMKIEHAQIDLSSVIQEAVAEAERQLEGSREAGSLSMAFSVQAHPPIKVLHDETLDQKLIIEADKKRLREVLDRLLENAVKYMPEGGTIHVLAYAVHSAWDTQKLANISPESQARLALAQQRYQRMAVISVQDSGKGIPAEALERIFDPFHRVDTRLTREVNGLGVGLTICRRIIELHHGLIWADSEAAQGSTLVVCLPLTERKEANGVENVAG